MYFLMRLRPSNMIVLAALPFVVYLFASSNDYQRSLLAILGVEPGSSAFVPGFVLLCAAFCSGIATMLFMRRHNTRWAVPCAALNLLSAAALMATPVVYPYLHSVVANGVDPFTSDLVMKGVTPRRLTEAAALATDRYGFTILSSYLGATVLGLLLSLTGRSGNGLSRSRKAGFILLATINGLGLFLVLFAGHMAFAAGVATTIRAAISAYIIAALLALLWVGLQKLQHSSRGDLIFIGLTLLMACMAAWFLFQPRQAYTLAGTLDSKIGVVTGTPSSMIGTVRYGQFPGGPENEVPLRTFRGSPEALAALGKKGDVSAVLLPAASVPANMPVLWQTEALNDRDKSAGIAFVVLAIALGLLTACGHVHRRHPLSIGSEFIVDTIRGIPMLVIVLYVGLPLSGALKDATQGVIDPPNMARGVAAMALAYSAYLAEIFRSGINAIPRGQIEAARSLGLNGWQTARLVILPQAFRIIIPPLGNELIAILKDTSLLSILSIRDITQRMREFQSASFLPFAPYNSAAIFYILLTLAAASLVSTIERKYDAKHR
ncbi:amino acid ABC transporter permease [Ochrobactrum vermis]|uniref:Amino acid ABC transporter permease n=1 Tax=Ochrobactrum vermis TaxID=1827297 RepID=A0ABU8PLD2_9HYPH|nr:amino acid ABC transporter permease [Ochrobactrum vermis]PQZ27028.1 amino acid ABC transporter permease [Ochrobactrum vermis]